MIHGSATSDNQSPAHVVPHEDSVPTGLLRLAGEPRHQRRIGELVEERQEQARAHARNATAHGDQMRAVLSSYAGPAYPIRPNGHASSSQRETSSRSATSEPA